MEETQKPLVLIVEDEAILAMASAASVSSFGYSVEVAHSGEVAIAATDTNPSIKLILMDIDLGKGMDGTQAARIILEKHDLPIIFYTSHSERDMVERVKGITRYGYVLKSSGNFVLESSIDMAFELFNAKQREKLLMKQDQLRASIVSAMDQGLAIHEMIYDENGIGIDYRFIEVNPRFEELTGLKRHDIIHKRVLSVLPSTEPYWIETYAEVVATGRMIHYQNYSEALGKYFKVTAFRNMPGQFTVMITDVTADFEQERKIQTEMILLNQFLDQSPDSLVITDSDGKIIRANTKAEELLQLYRDRELSYNSPEWNITDLDGNPFPVEELPFSRVKESKKQVYDVRHAIEHEKSHRILLSVNASPLLSSDGEFEGMIATIQDITFRKSIEDTQRFLNQSDFSHPDNSFFHALARFLARTLTMDYVRIDRITGSGQTARNQVLLHDGQFEDAGELPFDGSPTAHVLTEKWCIYPEGVCRQFPNDRLLESLSAKGYIGSAILDRKGNTIGIMVLIKKTPIQNVQLAKIILELSGVRASGELERVIGMEKIHSLLAEKESLLTEVHHRIKNNMNTMTSLLSLQARKMTDEGAVTALREASIRIQSMGVLYDKLYRSGNIKEMTLDQYLVPLSREIISVFPFAEAITLDYSVDAIPTESQKLFNIGIIVNELITNIMKYAYNTAEGGIIGIHARKEAGNLIISIRDSGPGLDGVDIANPQGFGLQLVTLLTRQLEGRIEFVSDGGTTVTLTLPQ